ncbi:hypothetical protein, variant 1 [Aphanomyces invadans]|uniref:Myotubularin phosphatase domain-containing protein n=1 Tax=Aphanomyces invadans TaxID=157072 RepID=A0A024U243_9STRA|nr:hypothetical protein, variant 1 [Aphanomyces invadans]ETV99936.1 hypothetical protein, variant 1 [Aphanomyces invadans]|eukprot:XP_008871712.1 hypothetical protein, variant 1 [Aphanomyces invadans]
MSHEDDSWTAVETSEAAREIIAPESVSLRPDNLLHGETIECKVHAMQISNQNVYERGYLCLTTYRLLFVPHPQDLPRIVDIALCNIADIMVQDARSSSAIVSTVGYTLGMNVQPEKEGDDVTNTMEVACKNFEIYRFQLRMTAASINMHNRLVDRLESTHQTAPIAFAKVHEPSDEGTGNPWSDLEVAESVRLGMKHPSRHNAASSAGFRITRLNHSFRLCATYPMLLIVPQHVSDADLKSIAHFRARGRIPAITYRHRETDTLLARCSQPLVGLRRRRCASDEQYVKILQNHAVGGLYIIDCRHQSSAYGNVALGAGFEIAEYYNNVPLLFMNIENIHSMRDSIRRLYDLIKGEIRGSEKSNWLSCLEGTRWLEHVRSILVAATTCVDKMVDEKASLLVHCSDGWDRTAQLTSLVKVCCDPYFRTIQGFAVLIQQEWLAFGHRFEARCGMKAHGKKGYWDDDQSSPVFVQFIDAVWQMTQQAPCSFEFNEAYLIALLDEVYSRRSGTFLFDCDEQRQKARTHARCPSVWMRIGGNLSDISNPFYIVPKDDDLSMQSPRVLRFRWHNSTLSIWPAFYLRSLDSREAVCTQVQLNPFGRRTSSSDVRTRGPSLFKSRSKSSKPNSARRSIFSTRKSHSTRSCKRTCPTWSPRRKRSTRRSMGKFSASPASSSMKRSMKARNWTRPCSSV